MTAAKILALSFVAIHRLVGFTFSTKCTIAIRTQGSHSLTFKNSRIFPGLSRAPRTFFQDVVTAQQYLNVKINELFKIYNVALQQKSRPKAEEGKFLGRGG